MANPNGRPRSETVKLTKTARERFDRQLADKLPDIFTALFEAGTKEKDTAALSLLVNRAVPVRKGVPVLSATLGDSGRVAPRSGGRWAASGDVPDAAARSSAGRCCRTDTIDGRGLAVIRPDLSIAPRSYS